MADVNLSTRTRRLDLKPRAKPYWRVVQDGLHLGYRRSRVARRAGTWLARRYLGDEHYEVAAIGTADDHALMPGLSPLTFDQAQAAARDWARQRAEADAAQEACASGATVDEAVRRYLGKRGAKSGGSGRDASWRLTRHLHGTALADTALVALTPEAIAAWRADLRQGGRGADGSKPLAPATLARLLNDLRAALRDAADHARPALSAEALRAIKLGLRAPANPTRARERQILADADIRSIVDAAYSVDEDLGALVLVLAATGCRFSQAARLTVADLQIAAGRIMVPASAKGRGDGAGKRPAAIPLSPDTLDRLRPLTAGRRGHEALLTRWLYRQIKDSPLIAWQKSERRPWKITAEMSRGWRAAVAKAGLPATTNAYALRHSSIVRGLRAGLPVRLVASAHDTSVAMIERHYSAHIVDASEDLLRRASVSLASATVIPMRGRS
jgi:integrase